VNRGDHCVTDCWNMLFGYLERVFGVKAIVQITVGAFLFLFLILSFLNLCRINNLASSWHRTDLAAPSSSSLVRLFIVRRYGDDSHRDGLLKTHFLTAHKLLKVPFIGTT